MQNSHFFSSLLGPRSSAKNVAARFLRSFHFFTRDHLGSIRELTDKAGTIRARYDYDPVVSKFSCGFPVVEFQHAAQALTRLDFPNRFTDPVLRRRKKNRIPFPLVISFTVKMKNVIG